MTTDGGQHPRIEMTAEVGTLAMNERRAKLSSHPIRRMRNRVPTLSSSTTKARNEMRMTTDMHRRADGAYSMVERRTTHTERGRRRRAQQDDIRRKGSKQVASARDGAVGGGEGGWGLSRRPRRLLSQPTLPTAQQHDVTRIPCESRFSMPGCDLHPSARQGRGPGEIQTVRFGKPPCHQQALPRATDDVCGRVGELDWLQARRRGCGQCLLSGRN